MGLNHGIDGKSFQSLNFSVLRRLPSGLIEKIQVQRRHSHSYSSTLQAIKHFYTLCN